MHMLILVTVFLFGIGLIVGSFLNVVILRLHNGKSFVVGRSSCPSCRHQLSPIELIPLVSWLALRGRCRHCRKPISYQYPLVEVATGLLFALTYLTHQPAGWWDAVILLLWLYVISSLVVLTAYDLRWYLLPDKVLLPLIVPALLIAVIHATAAGSWQVIVGPMAAAIIFGGGFYALAAVSRGKWMGGGDIKLAFVMGLLLGLKETLLAMFVAFNVAAVIAVFLLITKRKKRADRMPFGPFLILGTLVAFFWGQHILEWYTQTTGLYLLG